MPILTRTRNLELLRSVSVIVDELKEYDDCEDSELFWKLPNVANYIYDTVRDVYNKNKEIETKEREIEGDNPSLQS